MSVTFKGCFKQRIQIWYGSLGPLALLLRLHPEHDVAPFAAYTTLGLKKLSASNTFVMTSTKCLSQEWYFVRHSDIKHRICSLPQCV